MSQLFNESTRMLAPLSPNRMGGQSTANLLPFRNTDLLPRRDSLPMNGAPLPPLHELSLSTQRDDFPCAHMPSPPSTRSSTPAMSSPVSLGSSSFSSGEHLSTPEPRGAPPRAARNVGTSRLDKFRVKKKSEQDRVAEQRAALLEKYRDLPPWLFKSVAASHAKSPRALTEEHRRVQEKILGERMKMAVESHPIGRAVIEEFERQESSLSGSKQNDHNTESSNCIVARAVLTIECLVSFIQQDIRDPATQRKIIEEQTATVDGPLEREVVNRLLASDECKILKSIAEKQEDARAEAGEGVAAKSGKGNRKRKSSS